jgi:hypothetical protein
MLHSQGLTNNPYPDRNNSIPPIDTYLFKVRSHIVLPSTLTGLPVKILKAVLLASILATCPVQLNLQIII